MSLILSFFYWTPIHCPFLCHVQRKYATGEIDIEKIKEGCWRDLIKIDKIKSFKMLNDMFGL